MSVVGFDDVPYSPLVDPFYTVAIQPNYEMGRLAIELLVARLTQPKSADYQEIVLPMEIIVRQSSGMLRPPFRNRFKNT